MSKRTVRDTKQENGRRCKKKQRAILIAPNTPRVGADQMPSIFTASRAICRLFNNIILSLDLKD
jgi:hypothetical protein